MKNLLKSLIVLASVMITFASCQRNEFDLSVAPDGEYMYSFVVAEPEATVDAETKVSIGDGNIEWDKSTDEVGVFIGSVYEGYAKMDITATPIKAIIYAKSAIPSGTKVYSYFPYDAENKESDTYDPDFAKIVLSSVQTGASNSAMPLVGIPFEVEDDIEAQASSGNGEIKFLNLGSVINFKFYSTNSEYVGETVEYVTFAADDDKTIAGDAVLDLTAVDANDASTLALSFMDNKTNTVKVTESVDVAAAKADATALKMVVAPETFSGVLTVVTDVATYTVTIPSRQYNRSGSRTFNVNLDGKTRVDGQPEVVKSLPYTESFASNIGEFETDGVQVASTDVWQFASNYGMKASARVSGTNYEAESWLTSPWIDLTNVSAAAVTFQHVHQYAGTAANELTFWVLTDASGASWEQVTIPTYASGSNWTFVDSGEILLNAFVGNKVKIGFKYISSTSKSATWEIKNVSVYEKVYTTEFTKDADAITVEVGKTKNNHVTVNSGATITYDSDNDTIATVDTDGVITGVAEGTTTINYEVAANGLYPAANGSFEVTVVPAVSYSSFSWDLSTNQTVTATDSELSWNYRGVTMVAAKGSASTATNNYYGGDSNNRTSTRFYAGSTLTITPYSGSAIGYVEFTATSTNYANALYGSTWTNASATVDNTTVTVTPDDGTADFSASISGTCGFTEVTVYYTGDLEALADYVVTLVAPTEAGCSFTASVGGTAISSGDEVTSGTKVTLAATAGSDYQFASWSVKDASNNDVTVTNNEFTMPSSNVTVSAVFDPLYTITCNTSTNGTVSASPVKAIAGTEITLTITPDTGYSLDVLTVKDADNNDITVSSNKFTMPASNVTVSATFKSGGVTEYISTLTFTAKCNGSGTAGDGVEWTVTSDGTESNFDNDRGIHYGTNNAAVQYITLSTSDIPGTITKVVVNAAAASTATVSVTVDGDAFGGDAQTLTSSAANYTFEDSASGDIVVTVTKPSSAKKALYVKSITVTYEN